VLADAYSSTKVFKGSMSYFFQYDAGSPQPGMDFEFTISNPHPMNVFISSGLTTDPTEFTNDIQFKDLNFIKISSKAYPSLKSQFVMQLQVIGIDFARNQ